MMCLGEGTSGWRSRGKSSPTSSSQKYVNHVTHPFCFPGISIFHQKLVIYVTLRNTDKNFLCISCII